jgi:hypothetical protein
MNNFLVTIYLKHDILHKHPERYAVSDTIKEKIKQYINFTHLNKLHTFYHVLMYK